MKNIAISVTKSEILDEVSLHTAYMGVKTEAGENLYQRVAIVNEDCDLLERVWNEKCGSLIEYLKDFIVISESIGSSLSFTLEVSGSYDESMTPSLKSDIFEAMVSGVTAGWLRYSFPEKQNEWEDKFIQLMQRALTKLCHRKRPVRAVTENNQ